MYDPVPEITTAYAEQLRLTGEVRTGYATHQQRDLLRKAGRAAGRLIKRPVRTFDTGYMVHVVVTDWREANPIEGELTQARANKAVQAMQPSSWRSRSPRSPGDDSAD